MTYCFICVKCGYRVETNIRDPAPTCSDDEGWMRRDWAAEGANVNVENLRTREYPRP